MTCCWLIEILSYLITQRLKIPEFGSIKKSSYSLGSLNLAIEETTFIHSCALQIEIINTSEKRFRNDRSKEVETFCHSRHFATRNGWKNPQTSSYQRPLPSSASL